MKFCNKVSWVDVSLRERTENPSLPTTVALPCAGLTNAPAFRPHAHRPAESPQEGEHGLVDRGALVCGCEVPHEALWRRHADSWTPGAPVQTPPAKGPGSCGSSRLGGGGGHRRSGRWRLGVFTRVRCRVRLRHCVLHHGGRATHLAQALPHVLVHGCRGRVERHLLNPELQLPRDTALDAAASSLRRPSTWRGVMHPVGRRPPTARAVRRARQRQGPCIPIAALLHLPPIFRAVNVCPGARLPAKIYPKRSCYFTLRFKIVPKLEPCFVGRDLGPSSLCPSESLAGPLTPARHQRECAAFYGSEIHRVCSALVQKGPREFLGGFPNIHHVLRGLRYFLGPSITPNHRTQRRQAGSRPGRGTRCLGPRSDTSCGGGAIWVFQACVFFRAARRVALWCARPPRCIVQWCRHAIARVRTVRPARRHSQSSHCPKGWLSFCECAEQYTLPPLCQCDPQC